MLTTRLEAVYRAKCVVLATGTFLGGRVYIGDVSYESQTGRDVPGDRAVEVAQSPRTPSAPIQDRHARASQPQKR